MLLFWWSQTSKVCLDWFLHPSGFSASDSNNWLDTKGCFLSVSLQSLAIDIDIEHQVTKFPEHSPKRKKKAASFMSRNSLPSSSSCKVWDWARRRVSDAQHPTSPITSLWNRLLVMRHCGLGQWALSFSASSGERTSKAISFSTEGSLREHQSLRTLWLWANKQVGLITTTSVSPRIGLACCFSLIILYIYPISREKR